MEFTETVQEYRKAKKSAVSAYSSVPPCRMVHIKIVKIELTKGLG